MTTNPRTDQGPTVGSETTSRRAGAEQLSPHLLLDRLHRLQSATAALSRAASATDIADVVLCEGIAAIQASAGIVFEITDDESGTKMVRAIGTSGHSDDVRQRWMSAPLDSRGVAVDAARTGEAVFLESLDERIRRYPLLEDDPVTTGFGAWAALPLEVDGRSIGSLGFAFASARRFDDEERAFMRAFADQCAQALDRARLYEMERDARVSAEEARLEAETANRAKSDFLTVMSHELRTPLHAIMGYAVLLADGVTGPVIEAQRTQLTRIHASARHLLALIDDMLALSRLELGREQLHLESADIVRLTAEQAAIVDPTAAMKGLFVRFDCAHEGPLMLSTDPTKVRQILLNLLSNAIKFTHRGGIRVTLTKSGNDVIIAVTDSGIGIAHDHLERVFEAFWQVDLEHSRIVGGTGLGLDVSRRLARLLGGEIVVRSELGTGSTFELTLPWRPLD